MFRSILAEIPGEVAASYGLANVLCGQGRHPEAVEPMQAFVDALPNELNGRLQFGQLLRSVGRNEEAAEQFSQALALQPAQPEVWNTLGNIYRELQRADKAESCLRKAIEQKPELPEAWNNLGSLFAESGRSDDAVTHYREAIRLRPDYFLAWRNLTISRTFSEADAEVNTMQALYDQHRDNDIAVMQLGFALGKVCADLDEPARAFAYWRAGNEAQRKLMPFSVTAHVNEMRAMPRLFPAPVLSAAEGATAPERIPIFVIGMPRSGTSLTEQIIAAHSQGCGLGELETIRQLAWYAVEGRYPDGLEKLGPADWRNLGQKYLEHIDGHAGSAKYIVDKMPRNFQHVGIITMMLGDARFIHVRRDPMDIGLSCFKTMFPAADLGYCSDLDDFAAYYREYEKLMSYWQSVLPERIFELDYAALVTDPEIQVRRLLEWCDMPFEAECLQPHRQEGMIATASALQVREPINSRSVGRWKVFAQELEPLRTALRSDL